MTTRSLKASHNNSVISNAWAFWSLVVASFSPLLSTVFEVVHVPPMFAAGTAGLCGALLLWRYFPENRLRYNCALAGLGVALVVDFFLRGQYALALVALVPTLVPGWNAMHMVFEIADEAPPFEFDVPLNMKSEFIVGTVFAFVFLAAFFLGGHWVITVIAGAVLMGPVAASISYKNKS